MSKLCKYLGHKPNREKHGVDNEHSYHMYWIGMHSYFWDEYRVTCSRCGEFLETIAVFDKKVFD